MNILNRFLAGAVLVGLAQAASASFVGDSISVVHIANGETLLSGTATVGAGIEYTAPAPNIFSKSYTLDLDADTIVFTVSKSFTAGNFTVVLDSLDITDIDQEVLGVTLNPASSACDSGSITTNFTASSISILGCSLNSPASALSQTLIFDVTFRELPEPATGLLVGACLLALAGCRRLKSAS